MSSLLRLRFFHLPETFAICRLPAHAGIPPWAVTGIFFSLTQTHEELSIVCPLDNVPPGVQCSTGWRCLKLEGPFDLSMVGVIASLSVPLAEAGVSIFIVSTFNTDYLLMNKEDLTKAVEVLTGLGHEVAE